MKKRLCLLVLIAGLLLCGVLKVFAGEPAARISQIGDKIYVNVPAFQSKAEIGIFEAFLTTLEYNVEKNIGDYISVLTNRHDVFFVESASDLLNYGPGAVKTDVKTDFSNLELVKIDFYNLKFDIDRDIAWIFSDCRGIVSASGKEQEFSTLQRTLFVEYNKKWYVVNTRFYLPNSDILYKPIAEQFHKKL